MEGNMIRNIAETRYPAGPLYGRLRHKKKASDSKPSGYLLMQFQDVLLVLPCVERIIIASLLH
jgi:hypothetical protein